MDQQGLLIMQQKHKLFYIFIAVLLSSCGGGLSSGNTNSTTNNTVNLGNTNNTNNPVNPGNTNNTNNPVNPGNTNNTNSPGNTNNKREEDIVDEVIYIPCQLNIPPTHSLPNGIGPDPLEAYQWYLREEYANVTGAWVLADYANIEPDIQVGVVDNAVQTDHEDLNILDDSVINASINSFVPLGHPQRHNPYPTDCLIHSGIQGHGTSVAGVIAAKGNNKRGTKGVAYKSKVWGSNLILRGFQSGQLEDVFTHRLSETAIVSNSWGSGVTTRLTSSPRSLSGLIDNGLSKGFFGKGISYVFSAGNSRRNQYSFYPYTQENEIANSGDRSSYSLSLNHRGVIVVCAAGVDYDVSTYSEPGPNLWLCGYSSSGKVVVQDTLDLGKNGRLSSATTWNYLGLPTLDLSGIGGFNSGGITLIRPNASTTMRCLVSRYAFNFGSPLLDVEACNIPRDPPIPISPVTNRSISWAHVLQDGGNRESLLSYHRHLTGTSAAAPLVSGVIALVRGVNPELTWRDVKLILAESARQPIGVAGFINGSRGYSDNTTNYTYSEDYGFGLVDAAAAVSLAKTWQLLPMEKQRLVKSSTSSSSSAIVESADTNISFIEYVQVVVKGGQPITNFGDLHLELTSPRGVNSTFVVPHQCVYRIPPYSSPFVRIYKPETSCRAFLSSFTFGAAKYLGEKPAGEWQLTALVNGTARELNWDLLLYGH